MSKGIIDGQNWQNVKFWNIEADICNLPEQNPWVKYSLFWMPQKQSFLLFIQRNAKDPIYDILLQLRKWFLFSPTIDAVKIITAIITLGPLLHVHSMRTNCMFPYSNHPSLVLSHLFRGNVRRTGPIARNGNLCLDMYLEGNRGNPLVQTYTSIDSLLNSCM